MNASSFFGLAVLGLIGVSAGLGAFTFVYARGGSYLSNDPAACANCHVMKEQLDAWTKSSHRSVATCNDCHAPHTLFGKYATKAINGFNHSLMFTLGGFHEPIKIGDRNRRIAENSCRYCHQALVSSIGAAEHFNEASGEPRCTSCHPSVGHLH